MHTTTFTSLALALLFSPALSSPAPLQAANANANALESRALDMTVKFFPHTNCNSAGGPNRDYSRGTCLALPESSHGVKIIDWKTGCYLRKYTGGNCDGASERIDDTGCHDIGDAWNSLKFVC